MTFEVLHGAFVLLRGRAAAERAEIAAPPGLRILLARIEPILAGCELADHGACAIEASPQRQIAMRSAVPETLSRVQTQGPVTPVTMGC